MNAELQRVFEELCLARLRSGRATVPDAYQRIAQLTPNMNDGERYSEAFRLLSNVARGIDLQAGRGDASRVWAVTSESVAKLRAGYMDLFSESVRQLFEAEVAAAEAEAADSDES